MILLEPQTRTCNILERGEGQGAKAMGPGDIGDPLGGPMGQSPRYPEFGTVEKGKSLTGFWGNLLIPQGSGVPCKLCWGPKGGPLLKGQGSHAGPHFVPRPNLGIGGQIVGRETFPENQVSKIGNPGITQKNSTSRIRNGAIWLEVGSY